MNNNAIVASIVQDSIKALKKTDTVEKALQVMRQESISSIVIVDESYRPIGIFTERDSLKIIAQELHTIATLDEVMTKNVFTIIKDTYIHDAYVLMEQKSFRHIVVVDEFGKFSGVVTEGDFLREMGFESVIYSKNISDTMSDSIVTVAYDETILTTAKIMNQRRSDYAIVIKDNKPQTVITERDITHYHTENKIDEKSTVAVFTQNDIHTIEKEQSLEEASKKMQAHSVHQLVVLNDNKELIGLITRHDILKSLHSAYFDFLLGTIAEKTKKEKILIEQAEALETLANYDTLTNLPNRILFIKLLKKSLANALRSDQTIAIAIFDINRFREINDSYGHAIGDELLKKVASRLENHVRKGDVTARLIGNEFAIIFEHVKDQNSLPKLISKILDVIATPIGLSNDTVVNLDAHAGVVIAPKDSKDVDQIMQFANTSLHQAKKEPNGTYKFYENQFLENSVKKVELESALRDALNNGGLELYYQPQVHIQTDKIISAEALLRWKIDDNTYIPPSKFIPVACESGLINDIGKYVIFEACRQGKEWYDKGYHLTIAVNISANQIKYQENLSSLITEALDKYQYDPHRFEIEVTEGSVMQREEEVVSMLYALRAKGVKLAIDDFGTGYSSLAYLKRFPIDVLKIDKSFVDDLPYEEDDCAIATTIIEMGKALGYQVLAEGIENKEQLDFLKEKGCHTYQGFFKSEALNPEEFEALLIAGES